MKRHNCGHLRMLLFESVISKLCRCFIWLINTYKFYFSRLRAWVFNSTKILVYLVRWSVITILWPYEIFILLKKSFCVELKSPVENVLVSVMFYVHITFFSLTWCYYSWKCVIGILARHSVSFVPFVVFTVINCVTLCKLFHLSKLQFPTV